MTKKSKTIVIVGKITFFVCGFRDKNSSFYVWIGKMWRKELKITEFRACEELKMKIKLIHLKAS